MTETLQARDVTGATPQGEKTLFLLFAIRCVPTQDRGMFRKKTPRCVDGLSVLLESHLLLDGLRRITFAFEHLSGGNTALDGSFHGGRP